MSDLIENVQKQPSKFALFLYLLTHTAIGLLGFIVGKALNATEAFTPLQIGMGVFGILYSVIVILVCTRLFWKYTREYYKRMYTKNKVKHNNIKPVKT